MLNLTQLRHATTGLVLAMGLSLGPLGASAQDDGIPSLHALIADLKSQNAELKELVDYQKELLALLNVDPAAVWAARRPYSECLTSVLASYCEPFGAMYLPPSKDTINQTTTGKE